MGPIESLFSISPSTAGNILIGIVVIDICLLLIVLLLIYINNKKKEALRIESECRRAAVASQSERFAALRYLAQQANFIYLHSILLIKHKCSSKQEFDNYTFEQYLASRLDDESFLSEINMYFDNAHHNQREWIRYQKALQYLPPYSFNWREEFEMCSNETLSQPVCALTIRLRVTYTSPAGRNRYERNEDYSENDYRNTLTQLNREVQEQKSRRDRIAAERAKMTAGLRYDVMQRDGFRCVICGATAKDGAKLQVDHITPVSKGGKTVMSNLQTLCDRCNYGKRDKI